ARLFHQRVGAAVAIEAAGRRAFVVEEERGVLREVLERRSVAEARHVDSAATHRHDQAIGERVIACVTSRACDPPAGRKRRVVEDFLAQRGGRGKTRRRRRGRRTLTIAAAGGTGGEPSQGEK